MKLSFYPKSGTSPQWPGKGQGDYAHAGRTFDAETRANVPHAEPFTVESHDARGNMTREAHVFAVELCKRDGDVHPADKATADFCGVPFVEMAQDEDGEWIPRTTPHKASSSAKRLSELPATSSGEGQS